MIRKILAILHKAIVSPLLLPFALTDQKETIGADVKRWAAILKRPQAPVPASLVSLLRCKEFRNLYYFRIDKGRFIARATIFFLRILYRECPTLFLDPSCTIGPGLYIQHGFCTIVMADMGKDCWINQQVTIGYKDELTCRPKIGDNVQITAGAKVIGSIIVGNNVKIGANAVVVKNVPGNCTVAGVPARIVRRDGERVNEPL